ncbi:putative PurR-regulated permease PerM [Azospirillum lipoferum]|uniref:AI-2E family transporter n=1 Tax=Azospirillum lipoferum TaxID=193 RepID=A0A5A9GHI7_AZOLI|nr:MULTISPECIES: AI-2E family transporter [Azospirillum]KAA0593958.1 AI-2E family transporter [Azospirillum lipoferum]MCP1612433.1 putative PurR-regulated permease PerM [Azospirillum lipoferum]MDW5531783.1 AI-2E family transporter [Azospirillum sp. NL1]
MAEDTARRLQARPIAVTKAAPPASTQTILLIITLIVVTLYVAADILMPIALAVLLGFVLTPIVSRLERWRLGRVPSVLAVVVLLFLAIIGFGAVVGSQLGDLADNLPAYQRNIHTKIESLRSVTASAGDRGALKQATDAFRDLQQELERATAGAAPAGQQSGAPAPQTSPTAPPHREPVPVRIDQSDTGVFDLVGRVLGPAMTPVATAGMVLVFTIFMLLQREDLRDRLIRLVGSGDLSRTTEAMNDAGERVSRYLLMQVVVNVTYGLPIGVGLWLLGVPNPLLWGLLATVLRFIPFLGPVIASAFPILLSFAVDTGWTLPLLCIALFVAVELFSNNVVEPWLYGTATGLSSLAIIIAAVVWTTLWGPVGLLLATPLTVCLVVLGRHVPQLHFLEVMLGDRPVLPDEAKVYQRLLARDPTEATELAEERLGKSTPVELADGLLLPALSLAEQDRQRGSLNPDGRQAVAEGMASLLDELTETTVPADAALRVLCVGARNNLDEAAAGLLAYLLAGRGIRADVIPCEKASARAIASLGTAGVDAVVLSSLNPSALGHCRRMLRRLRLHFGPHVPILLCLWSAHPEAEVPERASAETDANLVATGMAGALAQLEELNIGATAVPSREAEKIPSPPRGEG